MWGHYGSKIVGVFPRPPSEASDSTTNILWRYKPSLYGGLCPIYFSRELGFVALYLCSKFRIFDRPILEEFPKLRGAHNYFGHAYV